MKHGASQISSNKHAHTFKKAKITKTLRVLITEVNQGNYNDFREWLAQTESKRLILHNYVEHLNLSHLGKALQDTAVTQVDLSDNNIDTQGAKDFAAELKGTKVTQVDLSNNRIHDKGAKDFAAELKGTKVTQVDLSNNYIGPQGAKDFAAELKGTAVTQVDLSNNFIGL